MGRKWDRSHLLAHPNPGWGEMGSCPVPKPPINAQGVLCPSSYPEGPVFPSAPRGSHVPVPQVWVFHSTRSCFHTQVSHAELVPASDKDKSPKMGFGGTVLPPDTITAGGAGAGRCSPHSVKYPQSPCCNTLTGWDGGFPAFPKVLLRKRPGESVPGRDLPIVHTHTAPSLTDTLKPSHTPTPPSSLPPHPTSPPEGTAHTLLLFFNQNSFICNKTQSSGGAGAAAPA